MPITELHKRKLTKNLTLAGILMGIMALLFVLTLVKLGGV
jgi:hypothetical protein